MQSYFQRHLDLDTDLSKSVQLKLRQNTEAYIYTQKTLLHMMLLLLAVI